MLIDWFTVGAQVLNFLVLVWLMKRFLYKPVLAAIDAREGRIAAELADADSKRTDADRERDEFQRKNEEFEQRREALLSKATDDAQAERARLLDEARKAADALSAKRQEALQSEAQSLVQALRSRTQHEVFAIARRALGDLAGAGLEERIGEVFVRRLSRLAAADKSALAGEVQSGATPVIVRSVFDLPEEQRANVQRAINEALSADVHLEFETAPELVSGIEITSGGQRIGWSIADYLSSMEQGVGELLNGSRKPRRFDKGSADAAKPIPPEE